MQYAFVVFVFEIINSHTFVCSPLKPFNVGALAAQLLLPWCWFVLENTPWAVGRSISRCCQVPFNVSRDRRSWFRHWTISCNSRWCPVRMESTFLKPWSCCDVPVRMYTLPKHARALKATPSNLDELICHPKEAWKVHWPCIGISTGRTLRVGLVSGPFVNLGSLRLLWVLLKHSVQAHLQRCLWDCRG